MKKPNFTPGPWYIFSCPEKYPGIDSEKKSIIIFGSEDDSAGIRGDSKEEILSNARLIAASPDMYAALYQILDRDECFLSEILCEFEIKDARAALAKARGENEPNKPNI